MWVLRERVKEVELIDFGVAFEKIGCGVMMWNPSCEMGFEGS